MFVEDMRIASHPCCALAAVSLTSYWSVWIGGSFLYPRKMTSQPRDIPRFDDFLWFFLYFSSQRKTRRAVGRQLKFPKDTVWFKFATTYFLLGDHGYHGSWKKQNTMVSEFCSVSYFSVVFFLIFLIDVHWANKCRPLQAHLHPLPIIFWFARTRHEVSAMFTFFRDHKSKVYTDLPEFFPGKLYFLFTLLVFCTSQALLVRHNGQDVVEEVWVIFGCRLLLYILVLPALLGSIMLPLGTNPPKIDCLLIGWVPEKRNLAPSGNVS